MTLVRWDPFGELLRMQRDVDRVFSRLGEPRVSGTADALAWMPKVNVKSAGDDVIVYAELPGLDKDAVDIEVEDGVLTISGERRAEEKKDGEGWLIKESSYGRFERSISLPEGVEPDGISAEFKDGVLEVRVPKAAAQLKPKTYKIPIGATR